jgi:hypothetical protein
MTRDRQKKGWLTGLSDGTFAGSKWEEDAPRWLTRSEKQRT